MNNLQTIFKTGKLAWKESLQGMIVLHIFILVLHTILSTAELMLEKNVIDKIYNIGNHSIKSVVLSIVLFFLLKNMLNVIYTIRYFIKISIGPKFDLALRKRLIDKISRLNLVYFEDAELFNLIEKAKRAAFHAVVSFDIVYHTTFSHLATVISITIFLAYLKPWLVLILFFAAIPKILNFFYRGRSKLQLENEQAPIRRKYDYYNSCIADRKYYKESRLFGSFHYFQDLWANTLELLNNLEWKNSLKLLPMELLVTATSFFSYVGTLSLAIYYLYQGEISLGAFATVLSALSHLDARIEKILNNGGKAVEYSGIASNYFTFMELDERNTGEGKAVVHPVESICFENVTFTYPSLERNVIQNLSVTINKGETIAIVGLNGAGKTTFIKLLLGLLKPTSGKIMYNDIDIAKLDDHSLHSGTSALFQTFGKYLMSVRENIAISQADRMEEIIDIESGLEFVDFDLDQERFPDGLETKLGKEFGGTDLSGGQWQLIALARAYFRENDLIILDEPTSAIDPILENEIFKNFHHMCKDKTGIIVTHRLGATKIADRIIVFENGTIIEEGSHEELMESGGKYAELYMGQSKWYDRNEFGRTGTL